MAGDALKDQLHALIAEAEALEYGQLWDALAYTDKKPAPQVVMPV